MREGVMPAASEAVLSAEGLPPANPDRPRPSDLDRRIVVEINDLQKQVAVEPDALAALAREVLRGEGVRAASISLVLVDDAAIRAINRRELQHDWPTDVITFALSGPEEEELAAELVVSGEMAATTARGTGGDPFAELALYVVHGLLHLCGYDDRTPEEIPAMRRREGEVLAALGLVNPFSAVVAGSSRREEDS